MLPPDSSTCCHRDVLGVCDPSARCSWLPLGALSHPHRQRPSGRCVECGYGGTKTPAGRRLQRRQQHSQKAGTRNFLRANFRLPLVWRPDVSQPSSPAGLFVPHFPSRVAGASLILLLLPPPPTFRSSLVHFLIWSSLSSTLEFLKQAGFHCQGVTDNLLF